MGILKRIFKKRKYNYYVFSIYVEERLSWAEIHNIEGWLTLRTKLKDWEDFQKFKREYVKGIRKKHGLNENTKINITGITYLGVER